MELEIFLLSIADNSRYQNLCENYENERNGKESVSATTINRTYSREHLLTLYANTRYYASNQLRRSYSANYKFGQFSGLAYILQRQINVDGVQILNFRRDEKYVLKPPPIFFLIFLIRQILYIHY